MRERDGIANLGLDHSRGDVERLVIHPDLRRVAAMRSDRCNAVALDDPRGTRAFARCKRCYRHLRAQLIQHEREDLGGAVGDREHGPRIYHLQFYCKGDIVLLMQLGDVLRKWRKMSDLTLREAAARIGLQFNTLARIETGEQMDGATLAFILRWLSTDIPKGKE